ncbi:MAG: hypothetical protein WC709_13290 [Thermoleophilia bacterium]
MDGAFDHRYACDERFPGRQALRLVRRAIERHRLDLTGLCVLTEAGGGHRRVTAVIAALAGADAVYAVGRDGPGADRRQAEEQTMYLAALAGVQDRVHPLTTRLQAPLGVVDIVTDLPGVRPIDESVVRIVAESAAVSLMRGVVHWRAAELDVATCRRRGIAVAGVDEDAIDLHRYAPMQATWGLLQLGVEVVDATLLLAGDGPAYAKVARGLAQAGARVLVAAPESAGRISLYGGLKVGDGLGEAGARGRLGEADAVVLCPARPDERTVAPGGWIDAGELAAAAPHLGVVSLSGELDRRGLQAAGLRCWPGPTDPAPLDLLPQPLIDLYAAGFKVGEVLTRARRRGSSPLAAEQLAAAEACAELLPKDLGARR